MEDGAIQGGIGALSGGVLGGLGGGLDAVRDGRNFWHGGRSQVDIRNDILKAKQKDFLFDRYNQDCTYTCQESNSKWSRSGYHDKNYYKKGVSGPQTYPQIKTSYKNEGFNLNDVTVNRNTVRSDIASEMLDGRLVTIGYKTRQGGWHNANIYRAKIFDNGKGYIKIMDPWRGNFHRLTKNEIFSTKFILSLF